MPATFCCWPGASARERSADGQRLNQGVGSRYGTFCSVMFSRCRAGSVEACSPCAKTVINVEQNYTGQLAGLVRESCGSACGPRSVPNMRDGR
jgi:hypothetical protein